MIKHIKPYCVRNRIINKSEISYIQQNTNNNVNDEYGNLKVSIYSNNINNPIENAEVLISLLTVSGLYQEKGEGTLITTFKTDADGYAPLIRLPALNKMLEPSEENITKLYVMSVFAVGHFNAYVFDLQIYPDVTTSYKIILQNVEAHEDPRSHYEFIFEPNILSRL